MSTCMRQSNHMPARAPPRRAALPAPSMVGVALASAVASAVLSLNAVKVVNAISLAQNGGDCNLQL